MFLRPQRTEIWSHSYFHSQKSEKVQLQVQKCWKKTVFFFEKIIFFLQGDTLGPIECGFEKSSELFFQKVQNWQSWSKNIRGNFHKMFLWMCNMQFRESSQKKVAKVRRFFDQSLKRTKKFSLLKALFSSKNHFCVYRLQNWQACQDSYANSPKITAPSPKEMEKGDSYWKRLFLQDGPLGW